MLALTVALMIAVLGLASAISFGHAHYEATASVRILPTYDTRLLTGLDPSVLPNIEYRSFVQQQVFEIDNPDTVIEGFNLLGPKASLWQLPNESKQHAAERLLKFLKVEWVPDTFLITVSLQGAKPEGLAEIVNAVVNAYLSRQEKQELSGTDTRLSLLNQRRATLEQQAEAERAQLSQLAQELGVSTFAGGESDPYNRTLADANDALDRQRRQLIVEQAHLAALQAKQARPSDVDLNALAQKIILDTPGLDSQKADLQKQRESVFLQLRGLSANHPGRPALEQESADIDKEIAHIDSTATERARSILLGTRSAEAQDKIAEAQTRVDQAQRARDGIEQEVAGLRASVASFGAKYNQALAVHEQFESHSKAIDEIDDRIDVLRLQSQTPGIASLELPAQFPDQPEGGRRKIIFGLSILLALLFACAVPAIVDLTDSRVRSSRELEMLLEMPVLGSTFRSDGRSDVETLRRIALGILRERRQAGTRVFVITAVGQEAGTTSLTLALANELTGLNTSTVAVEANARFADIRYQRNVGDSESYFASNGSWLGNGKKLSNGTDGAIAKRGTHDLCVHRVTKASSSLPDRVPICQSHALQRLDMRCVQEVLELALAGHDLVLMDAPPVLSSADTAMLVQNPAGVIVVVCAGRDRLSDVAAAVDELNKLSPPVIGIVLQRSRAEDSEASSPRQDETELVPPPALPKTSNSLYSGARTERMRQYS